MLSLLQMLHATKCMFSLLLRSSQVPLTVEECRIATNPASHLFYRDIVLSTFCGFFPYQTLTLWARRQMLSQMANFDDAKEEVGVPVCSLPVYKDLLLIGLTNIH